MNTWTVETTGAVGGCAPNSVRSRISRLIASFIAMLLLANLLGCAQVGKEVAKRVSMVVLKGAAHQAIKHFGEKICREQRLRREAELRRLQPRQPFANPTDVQIIQGTTAYQYNASAPLHVIPNNWGGWNFYTPDNVLVGFCVPEMVGPQWTGRYLYFDPLGNPILR